MVNRIKLFAVFFILALVVLSPACAASDNAAACARLLQGEDKVKWEDFNSVVLVQSTRSENLFNCVAVAIARRVLLTAAHCLDGVGLSRIFFASPFDTSKQQPLLVAHTSIHPDYKPAQSKYVGDLGIIELESDLPETVKTYPLLSWASERLPESATFERIGMAVTGSNSLSLRWTNPAFKGLSHDESVLALHDAFAQPGDSGGPIFVRTENGYALAAIHSTLDPDSQVTYGPFIPAYEKWIIQASAGARVPRRAAALE